ncbi:MAG: hypothetical protein R3Y28_08175 [Candidatus Gastranaerophilales bacterium]
MILPVSSPQSNMNFSANNSENQEHLRYSHDKILKNNTANNLRISVDKFSNALTLYPAKGLKGSKNSNFYEFLTMGTVPYIAGSATMMAVFNSANKHFSPFQKSKAGPLGFKMGLGVLFYGLAKEASKQLVTTPVKYMTGVDTELPFARFVYELPENVDDTDITSIEYHKAYESVDFPPIFGTPARGEKRKNYFNNIAKKFGIGDNLNDPEQEVKPRIKEVVVKTNLAKTVSSNLWAAVGVGLAMQKPWEEYRDVATLKFWEADKFSKSMLTLWDSSKKSVEHLYDGVGIKSKVGKHGGKALLFSAAASTVLGVYNVSTSSKKPSRLDASDIVKKDEKYVVN